MLGLNLVQIVLVKNRPHKIKSTYSTNLNHLPLQTINLLKFTEGLI